MADTEERHRTGVLVVDDDPQVAWVVRFALECEGYETWTASSGPDALARLADHRPELMILDVMMPGMDGWGVLARVCELGPGERPLVVMLTALASAEDRARAEDLGAAAFVTKPFDVDELLRLLEELRAGVA